MAWANAQSGLGETHMRLWLIWRNHTDAKQYSALSTSLEAVSRGLFVSLNGPNAQQLLLGIDEFPLLGNMEMRELFLAKTAGSGIRALLLAQDYQDIVGDLDADLDRLEHEQGTTAELWSGDRGAELERLELDPETHSERGRSERPERGIEDDEELER